MIARRMPAHRANARSRAAAQDRRCHLLVGAAPRDDAARAAALGHRVQAERFYRRPAVASSQRGAEHVGGRAERQRLRGDPRALKLLECDRPPTGGAALAVAERLDVRRRHGDAALCEAAERRAREPPLASAHEGARQARCCARRDGRHDASARRGGVQQRRRRPRVAQRGHRRAVGAAPWRVAVVAAGRRAGATAAAAAAAGGGRRRASRVSSSSLDSRARAATGSPAAAPPSHAARRAASRRRRCRRRARTRRRRRGSRTR